ncbi:Exosome complex component RRP42 [Teratosphaeria destructans]|uniref:Ribosomal RNA-processing protein 42 n=1 Tax=Teratosphaeria destructans TaxID=418781 RepID=A0A9W7SM21_9PEZI|nr:Exosome complex component RRP42 [Teratosphaeria destructans]
MAPYTNVPLSPAELSYLHTSLSHQPPIRPDARAPTQFRPLVAETDILPSANGSARICFADGTEAIVGVKAEVEKTSSPPQTASRDGRLGLARANADANIDQDVDQHPEQPATIPQGRDDWLDIAIDIPGLRDDDALPVFLSAMLAEPLLADPTLKTRLYINTRFHWRLYIDILLLSQPLSYPLPLLSLTTHLALLSTRLPALISEHDEDPLFNDDWDASTHLYPRPSAKPPVTLLVMSAGPNILFDPSPDELAVADAVLAISVAASPSPPLRILAIRTIDPPSRLTAAGVPDVLNTTTGSYGAQTLSAAEVLAIKETDQGRSVWRPPRGGVGRALLARMVKMVVERGGVGEDILQSLGGVEA